MQDFLQLAGYRIQIKLKSDVNLVQVLFQLLVLNFLVFRDHFEYSFKWLLVCSARDSCKESDFLLGWCKRQSLAHESNMNDASLVLSKAAEASFAQDYFIYAVESFELYLALLFSNVRFEELIYVLL